MKQTQHDKLLKFYSPLVEKYGYSQQSVGWGKKKGKQSVRYEILCQIGGLSNSSVLDVGCGFGDLYGYLKFKKIKVKYLGIDINSKSIEIGRQVYPNAKLEVRDFENKKFKQKFDWVFFSGICNPAYCNYRFIEDIMTEMFRICKKGIAMNFMGGVLDFKSKNFFYSDPEKIYSITRSLSNRVVIRHDYTPYEFTVYVYKNNIKTPNNVFKEFLKDSKMNLDDSLWKKSNFTIKKVTHV